MFKGLRWWLGVMEIEAWFLAEFSHFERVHADLTPGRILKDTGIDVVKGDIQLRYHPADDLHKIYSSVGLGYRKTAAQIKRTVDALSMDALYLDVRSRFPDLNRLLSELDFFFTKISP